MIKVRISNNLDRKTILVPDDSTLRAAIEKSGVNCSSGIMQINGTTIRGGDLDKKFEEFGTSDTYFIASINKVDNA